MEQLLRQPITYVIAAILLVASFLFLISMIQLRVARRSQYWRTKRSAGQRGGQFFLVSVTLFIIGIGLASLTGVTELVMREISPPTFTPTIAEATQTLTPLPPTPDVDATINAVFTATAAALPSATPQAPSSPSAVPDTPVPTATSVPPTPTHTATTTPEPGLILTPPLSELAPRPGARLSIVSLSDQPTGEDTTGTPRFDVGIRRVYVTMRFEDMDKGLRWTRVLFRDGMLLQGGSYLWLEAESGETTFFFGFEPGYAAGEYEIRLFIGSTLVDSRSFTIADPTE